MDVERFKVALYLLKVQSYLLSRTKNVEGIGTRKDYKIIETAWPFQESVTEIRVDDKMQKLYSLIQKSLKLFSHKNPHMKVYGSFIYQC